MAHKKTPEQISYNMSRVSNKDTALEKIIESEFIKQGLFTYERNPKDIPGKPDFVFPARRIAVFCDGDFWHGYNWDESQNDIKSNRQFWIRKIEKNIERDAQVNTKLREQGWTVFRFWGHEIKKNPSECVKTIANHIRRPMHQPYRTIDLCAGIGGIRKGFELTGQCENVLSAEIDKYACSTYTHLYGENPNNDLTTESFKQRVKNTPYEILLAGFPCQTFSRMGKEEGFENEDKGQIFFHIASIIKDTRPVAFFLENVDRLVTHDNGETFKTIIETLVSKLGYRVIGVSKSNGGSLEYSGKNFVRNSRDFGVPQNRPRTYIVGFDSEIFSKDSLDKLPLELPVKKSTRLYEDLNDLLEKNVPPKYYMASGYFETLVKHRARQEGRGYGFGYRIVNEPSIEHPVANTLLATGGSGKERNLIYDPKPGIGGTVVPGKKTPLNDKGIRIMTPTEWGKLQGFVNYAFINENGIDTFSFPEGMPDAQRYKQFGNSVTIPVIEEMANFIIECLEHLES